LPALARVPRTPGAIAHYEPSFFSALGLVPRVGLSSIYRLMVPASQFGLLLIPDAQLEVATVVRADDAAMPTSADSKFRDPLLADGWSLRGKSRQPMARTDKSGDRNKREPNAKSLMLAGGVELVEITAQPQSGLTLEAPGAWGFIRSPADVFFYTGHGLVGNLVTHRPHDDWLTPEELLAAWVEPTLVGRILVETHVLVINGCSVLQSRYAVRWAKLLRSNQGPLVAILGYASTAPPDDSGGADAPASLAARIIAGLGDNWEQYPRAWLEANIAAYQPKPPWDALASACAIDAQGTWYLEQRNGSLTVVRGP
jgi:hypothetical protein